MTDFPSNWRIDVVASRRRRQLIVNRPWWNVDDYFFLFPSLGLVVVGVIATISRDSRLFSVGVIVAGVMLLGTGVLGLHRNYSLVPVRLPGGLERMREFCRAAVLDLEWPLVRDNSAFLAALTPRIPLSWGRLVVILYDADEVLLGSCARNGFLSARSPYSIWGRRQSILRLTERIARRV